MKQAEIDAFQQKIWQFYAANARQFPWRFETDPYRILVSEVMLQQTQTQRVVGFYQRFLELFPNVESLAQAASRDVLEAWQGLGYNSRAIRLQRSARVIQTDHHGRVPSTYRALIELPGIGPNTAGAIIAYAFNQPAIFIETNIRKSIIDGFFSTQAKVTDQEINDVLEQVLDKERPREWYYALVDYGAHLAKERTVNNNRSSHYKKQSRFEGSNRQLRAAIIRQLLVKPKEIDDLIQACQRPSAELKKVLDQLEKEGLITCHHKKYRIS